jgi:hypothetical protein
LPAFGESLLAFSPGGRGDQMLNQSKRIRESLLLQQSHSQDDPVSY